MSSAPENRNQHRPGIAIRGLERVAIWLMLATLACSLPGAATPSADSTAPAAPVTPAARATSEIVPFSGEAVSSAAERLPSSNPFAPFPVTTAPPAGNASSEDRELPKLEAVEQLSETQQETLLAQGFVISPQPFASFAEAYTYGADHKLPAFITSDIILQTARVLYDLAWQKSEEHDLPRDLLGLCRSMAEVSQEQWQAAQDDATTQAALRNTAFFAICSSLLDEGYVPPAPVTDLTAEELTLINEGGRFLSPLFDRVQDYDPFAVAGHYARSEGLSQTSRALTWLAIPFSLDFSPGERGSELERLQDARLAARQALLMTWGLAASDNLSRWERLFQPGLFFYGTEVSWGVPQVQAAARALYGDAPPVSALADEMRIDDFLATVHTLPASLPFEETYEPAFALLAAPATTGTEPDVPVLRELVFNRVGAYRGPETRPRTAVQTEIGTIRGLPRTLDVASALGSRLAEEIIAVDGDAAYDGYLEQLAALRAHYSAINREGWVLSLDGAWLYVLQPLLAVVPEENVLDVPARSWQTRQLYAWHGAWMALRRETTLAPRAVAAVGISPDVAYGFIEPQPVLYGRLASLTSQILEGLGSRNLLDRELEGRLKQLQRLLDAAEAIARKELAGERLTADEALLLSQFVSRLTSLTTFEQVVGAAQTASGLQQVIDVALEPSTGNLLQAASGEAWPIYVLVPREEQTVLAMGALMSSFELHGEQIAAGTWRDMERRPPPPAWLMEFVKVND